jgi:hypothetical protein
VIDASDDFVLAKITREIEKNEFQLRTSKPHVKVSWEVKGTRNDPYMREHALPAEVEKPTEEKGTYIHPELYGMPAKMKLQPSSGS